MITRYDVCRCSCGATRAFLHLHGSTLRKPYFVRCGLCGSKGPEAYSEREAVIRWNSRMSSEKRKEKS